jgi:hypothetical protein
MTKLTDLSTDQLQRIIALKEQIEDLEDQLDSMAAGGGGKRRGRPPGRSKGEYKMSRAGRAAIAAAARARWANYRGEKSVAPTKLANGRKRRQFSAAAKAKMAAIARARWKKAKAAGKTTL